MARRPTKAPESVPSLTVVPLRPDGTRATTQDMINGTPILAGPTGYVARGGIIYSPARDTWMPAALAASGAFFRTGVPDGWTPTLEETMAHYFRDRLTELHATDEKEVRKAIRAISSTARKLKHQLDLPKAEAPAYQAAWTRIERARHPGDTGRNLRDELYPAMSLLTARLAALERRKTPRGFLPDSLNEMVTRLAAHLATFGIRAGGSNDPANKGQPDNLSKLARLAKAIIVGAALPPPCIMTDSALNKAMLTALKQR
jgi:hypothetical protein